MTPFKNIKLFTLIDIISDFKDHCANLETTGAGAEEIISCMQTIQLLQAEIDSRNQKQENTLVIAR